MVRWGLLFMQHPTFILQPPLQVFSSQLLHPISHQPSLHRPQLQFLAHNNRPFSWARHHQLLHPISNQPSLLRLPLQFLALNKQPFSSTRHRHLIVCFHTHCYTCQSSCEPWATWIAHVYALDANHVSKVHISMQRSTSTDTVYCDHFILTMCSFQPSFQISLQDTLDPDLHLSKELQHLPSELQSKTGCT